MKKIIISIISILVILGIVFTIRSKRSEAPSGELANPVQNKISTSSEQKIESKEVIKFSNPKKSAHYESNTPAHGSILAAVPVNVVIDFNFDLGSNSSIVIKNNSDEKDYGIGNTIIDKSKLTMRRVVELSAPDGFYSVFYKACWPDGSCHDGTFQFVIDSTLKASFLDLRNKSEVTVRLSEIKFRPQDIRINKGTKVVWINDDTVEHYVNTDAHPSHTYFPEQNSKALKQGDTYATVFNTPGEYPYHCSAHADVMNGVIIVEG